MANVHNPSGFHVLRGSNGGEPRMRRYKANVTTDIFKGDCVMLTAAGTIKSIITTTGSDAIVGVAANRIKHGDSTTPQDIWVYDDPDQEFELQDDGAGATPSQADVGRTTGIILGTGNTTTGMSKQELDVSANGATAGHPVLIEGFKEGPTFSIAKYASTIVKLNRHIYKLGSTGI